jgi:hypothetical protein
MALTLKTALVSECFQGLDAATRTETDLKICKELIRSILTDADAIGVAEEVRSAREAIEAQRLQDDVVH